MTHPRLQRARWRRVWWYAALLGATMSLGLGGCNKAEPTAKAEQTSASTSGPPMVLVVTPEPSAGGDVILGTVVPSREMTVTPQATGRIKKIHAKLGDYVKEGKPLVTLDPKDADLGLYRASAGVGVAKAGLRVAKTGLATAHREYLRFKKLHDNKTIPDATFDKARNAWLMAQAQVSLARKQLQLSRSGAASAYKNRKDTVTRAPFDGYVTRVMMYKGDLVRAMPPSHVMRFADVTPVVVEASIGELSLTKLPKPGEPIKLVVPGLGDKVLTPKMGAVMPALNPVTRAATLRIELPNNDLAIKLGLSVEIHLESARGTQLTLPVKAVTKAKGRAGEVYRVTQAGLLERVGVSLGAKTGSRWVITGGLSKTDRVVSDATRKGLTVGQRVKAVNE